MQFFPRQSTYDVKRLAVLDDAGAPTAERAYLVVLENGKSELLDPAVFDLLFTAEPAPAKLWKDPSAKPAKVAKRKYARKEAPIPSAEDAPRHSRTANTNGGGTVKDRILGVLQKSTPKSSGELIEMFPEVQPQSVYLALTTLRRDGEIETRRDPADGQNRNFLKK